MRALHRLSSHHLSHQSQIHLQRRCNLLNRLQKAGQSPKAPVHRGNSKKAARLLRLAHIPGVSVFGLGPLASEPGLSLEASSFRFTCVPCAQSYLVRDSSNFAKIKYSHPVHIRTCSPVPSTARTTVSSPCSSLSGPHHVHQIFKTSSRQVHPNDMEVTHTDTRHPRCKSLLSPVPQDSRRDYLGLAPLGTW